MEKKLLCLCTYPFGLGTLTLNLFSQLEPTDFEVTFEEKHSKIRNYSGRRIIEFALCNIKLVGFWPLKPNESPEPLVGPCTGTSAPLACRLRIIPLISHKHVVKPALFTCFAGLF